MAGELNSTQVVLLGEKEPWVPVVVALASALALLVFVVGALVFRSSRRHARLVMMQRRTRYLFGLHLSKADEAREIVEAGYRCHEKRIVTPPLHAPRVLPAIKDRCDARQDCLKMVETLRAALGPSFGPTSNMTMRALISCIERLLRNRASTERFLRIHESVLYGTHLADGTCGDVTKDEIAFLHNYFYNTILKEL
jgi:hypothetical protein